MRWPIRPLAEVAPVRSRKPEIFDGTRRYYSTGAVGKNGELDTPELVTFAERPSRANCMPKVGDVGFARMNGTQKVVLVSEAELGSLFSTGFCILEPNAALDSKYLFYFLTSEGFQSEKNALAGEGIMGGIKNSDVANMQIPLPPMSEQQRIVRLLDEALEGITVAKANAEKNLQNARALFNTHLDSALMQKEAGWTESTIGETCVIRSGTTVPSNQERPSGDIPYLKVSDLNIPGNSRTLVTSTRFLMRKITKPAQIIPVGASVFPKRGGAILTNKKRLAGVPVCLDLNLMSVTPKQEIDSNFLFLWFLKLDLRSIGSGSAIPQINNYDIEPLKITFPNDKARQVAIAAQAEEVFVESDRLASLYVRKLSALQMMENSLLSSAFHGELGVA